MDITAFVDAFTKACNDEYAREFTADEFKLGLTAISTVNGSTASATADADGKAYMYTEFAAVAVDKDGKILAALVDTIQPKIDFDTKGEITNAVFNGTKKELKDDYGMRGVSTIAKEWFEQASAFEAYVIGKTADEVKAIETVESNGHMVPTDEALLPGCTMQVTGYIESVAKAMANAQ